jgi:hypothetical protein
MVVTKAPELFAAISHSATHSPNILQYNVFEYKKKCFG